MNNLENDFSICIADQRIEEIIGKVAEYYPSFDDDDAKQIRQAYTVAADAHEGQFRSSGEPYITHPVAATGILLKIKPDIDTICACILHDVIEDTPITADQIEAQFGPNVRFLCEGVEKVARIRISAEDNDQIKFENVQKLFVAISKDIRVIFVKLADRIHNLRTLDYVKPEKRVRIARESLEIYAPIADRFGMHYFKNEIETLCFKNMHPTSYKKIKKQIKDSEVDRKKFVDQSKKELLKKFHDENLVIEEINGRRKDLYSIYKKMKRKKIESITDVHDFIAIRIMVPSNEDCYRALGILHSRWRPMPGRFKDYIALPKPNGYQSLHTTLLGLGQNTMPTEVQIRTKKMHLDAEFGPAAHWAYKQTGHSKFDEDYVRKTAWVPRYIAKEMTDKPNDFFKEISDLILSERLYVFTPNGDIKFFSQGSTPVDFAYAVHTDIGHACVGAKINGVIKPLNYTLKNGDIVSVLTRKGRKPNPLWLEFVRGHSTKDKIRSFIRREKEADERYRKTKKEIAAEKKELAEAEAFTPKVSHRNESRPMKSMKINEKEKLIIGGEDQLAHKMSPCCNPKMGDKIIAYKGRGLGFTIHKIYCNELDLLDPARMIEAYTERQKVLKILVGDENGVFFGISKILSDQGIKIHNIKTKRTDNNHQVLLTVEIYVRSEKEFDELKRAIRKTQYFIDFR
jgi:RelA/SpoT family (p)ppGpp synthetase